MENYDIYKLQETINFVPDMNFDEIQEQVQDKLKNLKLLDIKEQLPPKNIDVILILENGVSCIGHLTAYAGEDGLEDNVYYINSYGYATICWEDVEEFDIVAWIPNLFGFSLLYDDQLPTSE